MQLEACRFRLANTGDDLSSAICCSVVTIPIHLARSVRATPLKIGQRMQAFHDFTLTLHRCPHLWRAFGVHGSVRVRPREGRSGHALACASTQSCEHSMTFLGMTAASTAVLSASPIRAHMNKKCRTRSKSLAWDCHGACGAMRRQKSSHQTECTYAQILVLRLLIRAQSRPYLHELRADAVRWVHICGFRARMPRLHSAEWKSVLPAAFASVV